MSPDQEAGPPDDAARNSSAAGRSDHVERHRDGSVRARGPMVDGVLQGYWEWFRADGTKMRSGHFEDGEQVGEWTTYDRSGVPYKTTTKRRPADAEGPA